jgi:hypothetical protein
MRWLDLVQMRPGMYLGVSVPDFGALFDRLEGMIVGYTLAVQAHDVPDAGADLYSSFRQYLERRFGWNVAQGPIRTIRNESASDSEAWDAYWKLLADFRKSEGTG